MGVGAVSASNVWRVIVADDHNPELMLLKTVIERIEFQGRRVQVDVACSEAQARDMLLAYDGYALAVLDIHMEHEDSGLRLVDFIRTDLGLASLRIVLRSGIEADMRTIAGRLEIDGYISKQYGGIETLQVMVTTALRSFALLEHRAQLIAGGNALLAASTSMSEAISAHKLLTEMIKGIERITSDKVHALAALSNAAIAANQGYAFGCCLVGTEIYTSFDEQQRCERLALHASQDRQLLIDCIERRQDAVSEDGVHVRYLSVLKERMAILWRPKVDQQLSVDEIRLLDSLFKVAEVNAQRIVLVRAQIAQVQEHWRVVHHEFNTPLAHVRFGLGRLRQMSMGDATIQKMLDRIDRPLSQIGGMLDNRLHASRIRTEADSIQGSQAQYQLEKFSMDEIYQTLGAVLRDDAHGVEIQWQGGSVQMVSNRASLSAALLSLVRNAITACKRHPDNPLPLVEVVTNLSATGWRIQVKDNGVGMHESQRRAIWQPFASHSKMPSYGVGLNLVAAEAHAHKWQLDVESEPGKGSVFSILVASNL